MLKKIFLNTRLFIYLLMISEDDQFHHVKERIGPRKRGRPQHLPSVTVNNHLLPQLNLLERRGHTWTAVNFFSSFKQVYIWLSAKRCVCNGWLGSAENKSCLKNIFCHDCGLNVCENEWGYSWNNCSRNFEAVWEICLIKCDFIAEIQPWKTDSGTEPVSVGVVWLKKTSKSYGCERSFYKIHESERLPLNYAFVKSILNEVWSDVICVAIWNANFPQQTENNSDPWHERKWHHMHVRPEVNHSTALKRFNQTTFVVLTKFAAPQILLQ